MVDIVARLLIVEHTAAYCLGFSIIIQSSLCKWLLVFWLRIIYKGFEMFLVFWLHLVVFITIVLILDPTNQVVQYL